MEKVTYFDVEYANNKNKSICQIGIMCENFSDGEPYYPEKDIYINPEDGFDDFCIKVHGITKDKVKNEPAFPIVWKEIEKYFTNAVIIGHNVAGADLDALVKALNRYNLDIPELYYICTLDLARQYIPSYAVADYSMSTLCEYFGVDIDSEHNAFDDACACADLFKAIIEEYDIDIKDIKIKKYAPCVEKEFSQFVASPVIRKAISEFYGVIRGFSIDNEISTEEVDFIKNWKKEFAIYDNQKDIADIISVMDKIIDDGVITVEEIVELQGVVKAYLDVVSTSPITLATQILDGILKGITVDGEITEIECKNLRQWLYDNIYLSDHFPFNKAMEILDKVLEDSIITKEEAEYITTMINEMLNPVDCLKEEINSVDGKHVCLSGNFAYGQKPDVEKFIVSKGGNIDTSVKKTTDILMIGNCECQAYSNGTYGTKVKKAIEYNEKGSHIKIIKESDFFSSIK
ncbi:MAG: hypothetical protein E7346_04635 [Clostridiales bacterium]|nr:hypothetical protein [Clostridiales bacterium]